MKAQKNIAVILDQALDRRITFQEAQSLLNVEGKNFEKLLEVSRIVTDREIGRILRTYYPSRMFPPISITGTYCKLKCAHCNGHYLKHMIPAPTPEKLYQLCLNLQREGAIGCLISGGSTNDGYVPLEPYVDVIKRIKADTDLVLNVHTGLLGTDLAEGLSEAKIDVASIDVVGDNETIHSVYGLNKTVEDYEIALNAHLRAGIKHIVPHVCIGLNFGKISGELNALKMIQKIDPEILVFITIIPTRGTPMESVHSPSVKTVVKIIAISRLMFRKISISLGCMRPGGLYRRELDCLALNAVDRIGIPTPSVLKKAEELGLKIEKYPSCCALPYEFEARIKDKAGKLNSLNAGNSTL
ncbi:MAG: radical SAM protein [Candidatus Jordarchaeaceae archaeon]